MREGRREGKEGRETRREKTTRETGKVEEAGEMKGEEKERK